MKMLFLRAGHRRHKSRAGWLAALVAAIWPMTTWSLTPEADVVAAYAEYKKSGIVANDLIARRAVYLVERKANCSLPLNQLAFDSLSPEHQQALGSQGLIDSLGPVERAKGIANLVRGLTGNMTDAQQARFALEVGRGAAVRYRSEHCAAVAGTQRGAILLAPAAASAAAPSSGPVTGLDGWEGEVVGRRAEGSRFERLQIGMTIVQAIAEIGLPDEQNFSSTATNSFAAFKFGPDRYRSEHRYKGLGRLGFSSEADQGLGELRLTRIIHDTQETGRP